MAERTQVSYDEVFNNYILPNATDITGSVRGLINKGSTDITKSIGKDGVLVADTKILNKAIQNYLSGLSYFNDFLNELNSLSLGYGMMFDGEGDKDRITLMKELLKDGYIYLNDKGTREFLRNLNNGTDSDITLLESIVGVLSYYFTGSEFSPVMTLIGIDALSRGVLSRIASDLEVDYYRFGQSKGMFIKYHDLNNLGNKVPWMEIKYGIDGTDMVPFFPLHPLIKNKFLCESFIRKRKFGYYYCKLF